MFRSPAFAVRLALGSIAVALAVFLPATLPGGSTPSTRADGVFTVDSAGDESDTAPGDGACGIVAGGPCTLRAAIQEANATAGTDTVHFSIPPTEGSVISPAADLPRIVGPMVIDGTTQPGYIDQPLVELDGSHAQENGLYIRYGSSTIRGLAIHDFPKYGILVQGQAVIQGNVIQTNGDSGPFRNRRGGIFLSEPGGNMVGGTLPGDANVIAHNNSHGVLVGDFSRNNKISGNSIHDNGGQGIFVEDHCDTFCGSYPYDINPSHFPTLTSAERVGDSIVVRGIKNPKPFPYRSPYPNVTLEFFASRTMDLAGYGEGEQPLGSVDIAGDDPTFEATLPAPATGCIITATGTDFMGDTSSFSHGVLIDATPGVITVNSAADSVDFDICGDPCGTGGDGCVLREAVTLANATPGGDTIAFDIDGPRSISLNAVLPPLSDAVVIDGTTQPGFRRKPLIEINGALAGKGNGLVLTAGSSVVQGLVINGFAVSGIFVQSGDNVIKGNFIGTDASGTAARGNRQGGLYVERGVGNLIGGTWPEDRNVISGNGYGGVTAYGGGILLQGNFIGTDVTGTIAIGNGTGVRAGNGAPIGGPERGAGNVISGNVGDGIALEYGGAVVQGNKIGTTANGKKPLGNGRSGIVDASGYGSVEARDNIIAYNGTYGIGAFSITGTSLQNSIHSNELEGLFMWSEPPDRSVPPVVQAASRGRGRLTISGSAHATPRVNLEVEVFANEACDPSGFGEGQLPVGSVSVTTDDAGDASFSITLDAPARRFRYVTATTTTIVGGDPRDTSNFSNCLPIASQ